MSPLEDNHIEFRKSLLHKDEEKHRVWCDMQQDVREHLDQIQAHLDRQDIRFSKIEGRMSNLESQVSTLDGRMSNLEDRSRILRVRY